MSPLTLTDLPPEVQQRAQRYSLTSGQILVQQGERAEYLFFTLAGRVRLVSFIKQQMITLYFVEAENWFGEAALHCDTYGCTAIAETPAEVIAIPKTEFAQALEQSAELSQRYLASFTRQFRSVKTLLELRSISSARYRLLHYLMQRRLPDTNTVLLDKPLKAVASELAITPEGLSRLLSRLEADGMMSRKKRSITFSQEWLEEIAE